jgi:hypothetical protein
MFRNLVLLALLTAAVPARAEDLVLLSKTIYAPPAPCDGQDRVGAMIGPWEDVPIRIRAVALTHHVAPLPAPRARERIVVLGMTLGYREEPTAPRRPEGYAFVGLAAPRDGDLLTPVATSMDRAVEIRFPPDTAFVFPPKGTPGQPHIDLHLSCHDGARDDAWAVIYYTRDPPPSAPVALSTPARQ